MIRKLRDARSRLIAGSLHAKHGPSPSRRSAPRKAAVLGPKSWSVTVILLRTETGADVVGRHPTSPVCRVERNNDK